MKSYKEKQFLVFELEDGKNVKYNLATGETIGKNGRVVKDIRTQLAGYDLIQVIDSFEDVNYRDFLKFLDENIINKSTRYHRMRVNKISNIGSFLEKIDEFAHLEQYFACGIKKMSPLLTRKITEVPKGLLNIIRDFDLLITDNLIKVYLERANLFHELLYNINFMQVNRNHILQLLTYHTESQFQYHEKRACEAFYRLVNENNHDFVSIIKYADSLMQYEGIDSFYSIMVDYYDYVRMMSEISTKYTRYPRNFLTAHCIASRNYSKMKQKFVEEEFITKIKPEWEVKIGDYVIIYPKSTQEIKDEGATLNHCVASYIRGVIDGKCDIVFLRKGNAPDISLVTIEVVDYQPMQYRGRHNRDVTTEEFEIILEFGKKLQKLKSEGLKNE